MLPAITFKFLYRYKIHSITDKTTEKYLNENDKFIIMGYFI